MTPGLRELAALRRSGRIPRCVDIDLDVAAHPRLWANVAEMNSAADGSAWTIVITADECIGLVDLRALRDLRVTVSGADGSRVEAVDAACRAAAAARVISTVVRWSGRGRDRTCRTVASTDTDGVLIYGSVPA
jgi:hypothetical protein